MSSPIVLMEHQEVTADFLSKRTAAFCTSDPGTGKTISALEAFVRSRRDNGSLVVLAPLSTLRTAWADDIEKAFPDLVYSIVHGTEYKRLKALSEPADVYIANTDQVKWLCRPDLAHHFANSSHLAVDEFTSFKNRTSQRSKALAKFRAYFSYVWLMSGTPNTNSILDLWYPAFVLDGGRRLGRSFFKFREQVCVPELISPHMPHIRWVDRPDAEATVAALLNDATIRFTADECLDLPENRVVDYFIDLPATVRKAYDSFKQHSVMEAPEGTLRGVHANAITKKLLQIVTGAVHDGQGNVIKLHDTRYEFVMQLVSERKQCVVAFNYTHELDMLCKLANKYNFSFGVISGKTSKTQRDEYIRQFQNGELRIMFCHPQSAAHGITLTAGSATIWASPAANANAEGYLQLNKRIHRKGQTQRTETIRIAARDTEEIKVYEAIANKVTKVEDLLSIFTENRP